MRQALANYQATWLALTLDPAGEGLQTETQLAQWLESQPELSPEARQQFSLQSLNRLRQYHTMIQMTLEETLATLYPYTRQLLDMDWETAVHGYIRQHPPNSYQMYHCATAFPGYLAEQPQWQQVYPFLSQLADYELAEARLLRAPLEDPILPELSTESISSLAQWAPILNPVCSLISGDYPIQQVVAALQADWPQQDWLPLTPQPTHLWIYRDTAYQCRFYEVNALVLAFLQAAQHTGPSQSYLDFLATLLGPQAHNLDVQTQFLGLVEQLRTSELLLGSIPINEIC